MNHLIRWIGLMLATVYMSYLYGMHHIKTPQLMITITEDEELVDYTPPKAPSSENILKEIWVRSGGDPNATIEDISRLYREVITSKVFRICHPVSARAFGGFYFEAHHERRYAIQESHDLYGCPTDPEEAWNWIRSNPLHLVTLCTSFQNGLQLLLQQTIEEAVLLSQT